MRTPFRTITAALAFALSTSCAFAMPILKSEVTVNSAIVTLGDMFDNVGADGEAALFRAPAPGTTGNVKLAAVLAAAARLGITAIEANGNTEVRVTRAASLVDQSMLMGLIADDLRQRGILTGAMSAQTTFSTPFETLRVPQSDFPVRLDTLRYLPGSNSFTARFIVNGFTSPMEVAGTIDLSIEAPHLTAALPAGTVLQPEHITMRPVSIRQADAQGVPHITQLIGMALNRQTRDGMMLRASDVSTPLAVAKNDLVTIFYRQGPMTLTVKGQAVTGAATGQPLQVLNLSSRRIVSATAVSPGAVAVSTAPLALAGL